MQLRHLFTILFMPICKVNSWLLLAMVSSVTVSCKMIERIGRNVQSDKTSQSRHKFHFSLIAICFISYFTLNFNYNCKMNTIIN